MLVHSTNSLSDKRLDLLILVNLLFSCVKDVVFILKVEEFLAFAKFVEKSRSAEVVHILGFEISHKVYNFSICSIFELAYYALQLLNS